MDGLRGKTARNHYCICGYIRSHISESLLESYDVCGIDNFSSGKLKPIPTINADLLSDKNRLDKHFENTDAIFHFAANPDVRLGAENTKIRLEQNVIATYNALEAMRKMNVMKIVVRTP